jgi:hypothetical protein
MANTKTDIANLALLHMGTGKQISDLDTDQSDEAKTLRQLFDHWMETVLRGYNWNFAHVYANVSPIVVNPNQEWKFEYRYPADCLFVRRFWNGSHLDDRTTVVNFVTSNDSQGRVILTNHGPSSALTGNPLVPTSNFTIASGDIVPVLEYTQAFSNIAYTPPDFIFAFSLMLAGWAAPRLAQVGMVDMREKNLALGQQMMLASMARDANEDRPDIMKVGELTRSRMGSRMIYTSNGYQMIGANYAP